MKSLSFAHEIIYLIAKQKAVERKMFVCLALRMFEEKRKSWEISLKKEVLV